MKSRHSYKIARNVLLIAVIFGMLSCRREVPRKPIREGKRPDEMTDLVAKTLTTTQTYPLPNEQVNINLEVQNRASTKVEDVLVVLSAGDSQVDSSRISIEPDSITTVQFSWTAPSQATLTTLTAIVDPDQKLTEKERFDNVVSTDIVVTPQPDSGADFAVTRFDIISQQDQPTFVHIGVSNNGNIAAQAPLILQADDKIVMMRLIGPIPPHSSVDIDLPWPKQDYPTLLSAEINPRYRDVERNREDNYLERDTRPAVDLRVEGLSLFAAQFEQERSRQVTIGFRIINTGRTAITMPFRSSIFPGMITQTARDTHYVVTNELAASQIAYVSHNITLPENISEFDIVVKVDVDQAITEVDESNNIATSHFKNPSPDVGRWISIGPRRITGSNNNGYAWNDAVGRLSTIAIHPTSPSIFYVGARGSGVWKTTNGGSSWNPLTDMVSTNIAAIAIDPTNPSRIYFVTQQEGVFKSEDAGVSWIQISMADLDAFAHGGHFLINPNSPNILYVASRAGLYRSSNFGVTWQLAKSGGRVTGLVMNSSNPNNLYVGIYHESNNDIAGIYQTLDGGDTWDSLTGCPGGRLPANDSKISIRLALSGSQLYAGYRSSTEFQLYRTTSVGCSIGGRLENHWEKGWNPTGTIGGDDIYRTLWSGMWADPSDSQYVYLGGTYFWRSTDGGASFERTSGLGSPSNSAHVDHHAFAADPISPNKIYSLNDGGIYRSINRGASGTWTFLGEGIANVEFYDHVGSVTDTGLVIGGTQDNGTIKYEGSSSVWQQMRGGDGATVDIDPTDSNILYSMNQYASSIARSTNEGGNWTGIASGLPTGSVCFNLHYQVHPSSPSTLLASCGALWRTTSPGQPWSVIHWVPGLNIIRSAIDPSANLYYAYHSGSGHGNLYAGPVGESWETVFTHPTARSVTDIEVNPHDPKIVYASFGGTGAGRVFQLRRNSPTPTAMTAVDITFDLPSNLRTETIAVDRLRSLTIYVGTQKGVYRGRSGDEGTTWYWTPYNNGMPLTDIRDLEVHPTTGILRAASFGRSAFEVNTDFPIGSILAVEGKVTLLRVHDVGTKYGPPIDQIDVEVVIKLDSEPDKAFGFQLRDNNNEGTHSGMLDLLRNAFKYDFQVRIEYVRTGFRNGIIKRVIRIH